MNLYAPPSATLARQVCLDVLVVAWCVGWWFVGRAADSAIRGLAAVPRSAEQSARDLQERLNEAAEAAGRVPLAGESLRAPLDGIAQSVNGLIAGSLDLTVQLENLATLAGLTGFLLPVLLVVPFWLWYRVRFVLESRAVAALIASGTATEWLALRALTRQPLHKLLTVTPDPAGAWRSGDPVVLARLAALERRRGGWPRPKKSTARAARSAVGDQASTRKPRLPDPPPID